MQGEHDSSISEHICGGELTCLRADERRRVVRDGCDAEEICRAEESQRCSVRFDFSLGTPDEMDRTERGDKQGPRRQVEQAQLATGQFWRDDFCEREQDGGEDGRNELEGRARHSHMTVIHRSLSPSGCGETKFGTGERHRPDDQRDEEHHRCEDQDRARPVRPRCASDKGACGEDLTPEEEGEGEEEKGLFGGESVWFAVCGGGVGYRGMEGEPDP